MQRVGNLLSSQLLFEHDVSMRDPEDGNQHQQNVWKQSLEEELVVEVQSEGFTLHRRPIEPEDVTHLIFSVEQRTDKEGLWEADIWDAGTDLKVMNQHLKDDREQVLGSGGSLPDEEAQDETPSAKADEESDNDRSSVRALGAAASGILPVS